MIQTHFADFLHGLIKVLNVRDLIYMHPLKYHMCLHVYGLNRFIDAMDPYQSALSQP